MMLICEACLQPANIVTVDFGIGWVDVGYDYFHRDLHDVTACCEADTVELFEDSTDTIYDTDVEAAGGESGDPGSPAPQSIGDIIADIEKQFKAEREGKSK